MTDKITDHQEKESKAKPINPYKEKHYQDNQKYWRQLAQEFKQLEDDGFARYEIAEGLGISRQIYLDFMKTMFPKPDKFPEKLDIRLPIFRDNLLALYDYLTNLEFSENKKLSKEKQEKRKQLKERGADGLLEAAGFLPENYQTLIPQDINPHRLKKIYRLISRLSSPLVQDEDLWKIEDNILDLIPLHIDNSLVKKQYKNSLKTNSIIEYIPVDQINQWLSEQYGDNFNQNVKEKLINTVKTYPGKTEFEPIELMELYQSISENLFLRDLDGKFKHLRLRILDCQIKNLTLFVDDLYQDNNQEDANPINQIIINICQQGKKLEETLQNSPKNKEMAELDIEEAKNFLMSNPVREAMITWRQGEHTSHWRYTSTSPHLETLLSAVHQGFCLNYTNLKLSGLSIRSLGRQANSLVRVSVAITDRKIPKSYQGLWVDQNSTTCLLQAVAVAVENWWIEILNKNPNHYSELLIKNERILNGLYEARQLLSKYQLEDKAFQDEQFLENQSKTPGAIQQLEKVITTIQEVHDLNLQEVQTIYDYSLNYYECLATLMQARAAHIQGKLEEASKKLERSQELLRLLQDYENKAKESDQAHTQKSIILEIIYETESMIHKFYSGDEQFLLGKFWRNNEIYKLETNLEKMKDYINNSEGNTYSKNNNLFDFNLHFCISELLGNFGRLELYFCLKKEEKKYLLEAIDNFLRAAYFSLKIGDYQRVAHWLNHVSRVYSRLNEREDAENYAKFAEKVLRRAVSPWYSEDYIKVILAETNLAYGELNLIDPVSPEKAVKYFLTTLDIAVKFNFSRLVVDSLYGLSKSFKILEQESLKNPDKDYNDSKDNCQKIVKKLKSKAQQSETLEQGQKIKIQEFLINLNFNQNCEPISKQFQEKTLEIWKQWANSKEHKEHPIEKFIKDEIFLNQLK